MKSCKTFNRHSPFDRLLAVSRSGGVFHDMPDDVVSMDLSDKYAMDNFAAMHYPISVIVHLAAESRTGVCEKDFSLAYSQNVTATENILRLAKATDAYFLYVSTDMVFSGVSGNYAIDDVCSPINNYGRSKADAESLVQKYEGNWAVVRPALIYGEGIKSRISSLDWTLNALQNRSGRFFADEFRTPVFIDDLISLLVFLCKQKFPGRIHAGGLERLSRWEFTQEVAAIWDVTVLPSMKTYLEDDGAHGWRPRDLSLDSTSAHALVSFHDTEAALHKIKARHQRA